ncbi:DNA-directed RNA polymerases I, II, and III subunit RPABC1-like [Thrips palmi]|uniref:DNA-directed RNA polymerases I, II, and III subunit RPABC1 n=1 Tax=Thrips palmi TaxID=161013 RepID=A0A6P8YNF6_THRPL|nr:DNA-directed RNA polymerases I, II, and III subunit RPABC1-like [Thrips palmi]
MSSGLEIKQLWRVKKTIMQLCHDRGYLVTQDELDETLDEFKEMYKLNRSVADQPLRNKLRMLFTHSTTDEKLFVFFSEEKVLRKPNIVGYVQEMQKEQVGKALLIVQDTLTPVAKKAVVDFNPTYSLEVFLEKELLVNIMDHELVPKHIVLSPQEKEDLFEKYKLNENLLMRMQAFDPVAKYYGLRRGQVVKIIRKSETAGRYVSYRLVC